MRDIKFRAWDYYNKNMIHSDTLPNEPYSEWFSPLSEFFRLTEGIGEPLDMNKVMQYTGLKDKNGVQIYEGDIVKHPTLTATGVLKEEIAKIVHYRSGFFTQKGAVSDMATQNPERDFEVIGNIYENPELLQR